MKLPTSRPTDFPTVRPIVQPIKVSPTVFPNRQPFNKITYKPTNFPAVRPTGELTIPPYTKSSNCGYACQGLTKYCDGERIAQNQCCPSTEGALCSDGSCAENAPNFGCCLDQKCGDDCCSEGLQCCSNDVNNQVCRTSECCDDPDPCCGNPDPCCGYSGYVCSRK